MRVTLLVSDINASVQHRCFTHLEYHVQHDAMGNRAFLPIDIPRYGQRDEVCHHIQGFLLSNNPGLANDAADQLAKDACELNDFSCFPTS